MKLDDIKQILVLGAGTMGHQIGLLCALNGYDVMIYDNNPEMFEKARDRISNLADRFIAAGKIASEAKAAAIERIQYSDDMEVAAKNADLVTESVPEDPKLKAKIFQEVNKYCPEQTIFTTNTSSLVPSMIADQTGRPEKFLALHFHDIALTNVVDVMPHPGTSLEATELVKAFAEKLDQVVILLKKENFGYVFNAMLSDLFKSALTLASNGVAEVEDVDRAWMGVMNAPAGPFGIMDTIGVDTVWKVTDYWATVSQDSQNLANASFLKQYVDNGNLGQKNGKGFYSYPNPAYGQPGFIKKSK